MAEFVSVQSSDGEKVFAAGADVKEMAARNYAEMAAISRRLHAVDGRTARRSRGLRRYLSYS